MRKKLLCMLVLAVGLCPASARAADLDAVFREALAGDPLLGRADSLRLAAGDERAATCGQLWPQVTGKASYLDYDQSDAGTIVTNGSAGTLGEIEGRQGSAALVVSQTLFDMPKFSSCRQKRLETDREDITYERALEDLIRRTVAAYIAVLNAEGDLKTAQAFLAADEATAGQAEKSYKAKVLSRKDLDAARARVNLSKTRKIAAENALDMARFALDAMAPAARTDGDLAALGKAMPTSLPDPADPAYWSDKARENNLEVQESRMTVDISAQAVKSATARIWPSVDAFGRHSYYDNDFDRPGAALASDHDSFSTDVIGVALSMPLFTGGTNVATVSAAKNRFKADTRSHDAIAQAAAAAGRQTFLALKTLDSGIKAAASARESTASRLKAVRQGVKAETETDATLRRAQADMAEAAAAYDAARYAYVSGLVDFWQAVGALSAGSIGEINGWLVHGDDGE